MDNLTWWHVYLFTRLDILNHVSILGLMVSVVSIVAAGVIISYNRDMITFHREGSETYTHYMSIARTCLSYIKIAGIVAVVFLGLVMFVPSQKEAAAIYLLPKLVNSPAMKEAEKLPETLIKLLDAKMKAWISDSVEEQTTNIKETK